VTQRFSGHVGSTTRTNTYIKELVPSQFDNHIFAFLYEILVKCYRNLEWRHYYIILVGERVYGSQMNIIGVHTLGISIIVMYAQHDNDKDDLGEKNTVI